MSKLTCNEKVCEAIASYRTGQHFNGTTPFYRNQCIMGELTLKAHSKWPGSSVVWELYDATGHIIEDKNELI